MWSVNASNVCYTSVDRIGIEPTRLSPCKGNPGSQAHDPKEIMKTFKRNCNECNQPYDAQQRYLNRGRGTYCSRKCGAIASGRAKTSPDIPCVHCGVPFHRVATRATQDKQRFCSVPCMNASGLVKRGPEPTFNIDCAVCAEMRSSNEGTCAIHPLFSAWWMGDSSAANDARLGKGVKLWAKKALLQISGDRCEECGEEKHNTKGVSLIQIHHVDGLRSNNLKENLQLLCADCHIDTDTYGNNNHGVQDPGRSRRG